MTGESATAHCDATTTRKPHHCISEPVYKIELKDGTHWVSCRRHLAYFLRSAFSYDRQAIVKPLDPDNPQWG